MSDELIVLGSSSGTPTQRRFPSAYALRVMSKLFLLDCGAPVSTLLYRYGFDPIEVRAIFLSHWHMDHIANLGLLLSQNHQRKRPRSLNVYGPRGTRGKIQRLLLDSFIFSDELHYPLNVTNIKTGETYKEGLIRVTFFKTQHLERPKYKTYFGSKAVACGMIINGPGWRIVYSGDLESPAELAPYVKGCDLLIHEMAHHAPESVAEFVAVAKIPHVLISHLGLEFDEAPEKIVAAFAGRYDGDLIVAEDGTRVQLSQIRNRDKIEINSTNRGQPDD
jgi:ribonuclease BN (tRNA processing enzyme)